MANVIRKHLHENLEKTVGFCQILRKGDWLFLAGVSTIRPDLTVGMPGDFAAQTEEVYRTISSILEAEGMTLSNIVDELILTTDINALMTVGLDTRKKIFGKHPFPPATGLEVQRLAVPGMMIEVKITALK